jgi:tRNA pseudouridine38-40 synthase
MGRVVEATAALPGSHSFAAFAKVGQPERGVRCTVRHAEWRVDPIDAEILELEITADRFLQHMVRRLVGTLAEIGRGRRPAGDLARLLREEPGVRASKPAPAQGLLLTRVDYPARPARRRRAARARARRAKA